MAAIRKTEFGTFQVLIRRKGAKTIKRTFARKTDAVIWARQTETDIEQGNHLPARKGEKLTFNTLVALFQGAEGGLIPQHRPQVSCPAGYGHGPCRALQADSCHTLARHRA